MNVNVPGSSIFLLFTSIYLTWLKEAKDQDSVNACLAESDWKDDIDGLSLSVPLENIDTFIMDVVEYFVVIRCQSMIDQLVEGLKYYDVSGKSIIIYVINNHNWNII
jgi:hypothetical protein